MTKRSLTTGLIIVGIVAFCTNRMAVQIKENRRAAFDRGYAAATCKWTKAIYPEPSNRPPEAVEVMDLCKRWDGRLKP